MPMPPATERALLDLVSEPAHLRGLDAEELARLASEIRAFLVESVARSGGHLGSNLGVVELTLALHRVFDSPDDALIWDTGHQAYVHKVVTGRRERFASPEEAAALIAPLSKHDRALWGTAFFAGLRRGGLQALRWEDVDLASAVLLVERAWDEKAREFVGPKSAAGRRTVPLAGVLRDHLLAHKLDSERTDGLVFGTGKPSLPRRSGAALGSRGRRRS